MKPLINFLFLLLIFSNVSGQNYFLKPLGAFNEGVNTGDQIYYYNNRIFIAYGHFCGNLECCSIAELSLEGDTLWQTDVTDVDIGFETVVFNEDTITVTGNKSPSNITFRMAHYNLDGEKLGDTYTIDDINEPFTDMYLLTSQKIGEYFYLIGAGIEGDSMYSLLYKVNNDGYIKKMKKFSPSVYYTIPWDSDVDTAGNLITFLSLDLGEFDTEYRAVYKFNQDLDTLWSYRSEQTEDHNTNPKGLVLPDGRVLLKLYTPGANYKLASIRAINPDKTLSWEYVPKKVSSNARAIYRLKLLENGDIIGLGSFQDVYLDPEVRESPWIFRMNSEGEIIWSRVFYDYDPTTEKSRRGFLADVVQLPNGEFYGVGEARYNKQLETTIFKLDSMGCLDPENCDLIQFVATNNKEIDYSDKIKIYPNPAIDYVQIESDIQTKIDKIVIIDQLGKKRKVLDKVNSYESVDISTLSNGIYYLLFLNDNRTMAVKKLIKGK